MQIGKIESGVQLFSRVGRKTCLQGINSCLFGDGVPDSNEVIEITGDPSIDKTNLLIDFIVRTILPSEYNSEWKNSAVIFINTEFQINLFRIIKVLEIVIKKHNIPKESKKSIIENALKNLIVLNCYNLEEVEMTFYNVEKIIHSNENINLVIIDNIAPQFWVSRIKVSMLSYFQHALNIFEMLHNAIKNLQVVLIFVRNEASTKKKFSQKVDYRVDLNYNNDKDFKATVYNYEKQSEKCISLKLEPIVEFL